MKNNRVEEFEEYVRSLLRPLAASACRKRLMEEELVAHLLDSCQEEFTRLCDEQAAIECAKVRLGNRQELSQRLQASVPKLEQLAIFCITGKGMTMKRWIWLIGIVAVLFGMSIVLPALAKYKMHGWVEGVVVPFAIGASIVLVGLIAIGYGIARKLRARAE
jgi:hypothetical protein